MNTDPQSPAQKPSLLTQLGDSGSTRFIILAIWAFCLLVTSGVMVTASWLAMMGGALFMAHNAKPSKPVEDDDRGHPSIVELGVIGVWGLGPILVQLSTHPEKFTVSTVMLACGFLMVLGQYRNSIRPAIVVAVPYALLSFWFLFQSFGTTEFLYTASLLALLFGTFVTMTVFSVQTHKRLRESLELKQALIEELEESRFAAEESVGFKSRFLANMSHEIQTPLNGIIGMSEVMRRGNLDPRQRQNIDVIHTCGQTLSGTINAIIDLSKLEMGALKLHPTTFDIYSELDQIFSFWRPQAETKGLVFDTRIDRQIPALLHADRDRIRQCLNNLISNAVKFTNDGHIGISVGFEPAGDKGRLQVQIIDTGMGIPAGYLDDMFVPFMKRASDRYTDVQGTGLGLTVTKNLCNHMGGGVSVDSKKGRGSRFKIWFNVDVVATAAPVKSRQKIAESDDPNAALCRGRSILVVDDIDYNYGVIRSLIEPLGAKVKHAASGKEAMMRLQSEKFDLVFMDVRMPEMDGLTATRLIRGNPSPYQNVPIIAFTGHTMNEDIEQFRAAGMDGHFPKPVTFRALITLLERHLPRKRTPSQIPRANPNLRFTA